MLTRLITPLIIGAVLLSGLYYLPASYAAELEPRQCKEGEAYLPEVNGCGIPHVECSIIRIQTAAPLGHRTFKDLAAFNAAVENLSWTGRDPHCSILAVGQSRIWPVKSDWIHDLDPPACPSVGISEYIPVTYTKTIQQKMATKTGNYSCEVSGAPSYDVAQTYDVRVDYSNNQCPATHPIGPIEFEGQQWCYNIAGLKKQPKICEGNPVSVADGAKLHNETIFRGNSQHPLTLALSYSSASGRWGSVLDKYFDVNSKTLREEGGSYTPYQYVGERTVHGVVRRVWQTANSQNILFEDTAGYWQLQRDNGQFEVYDNTGLLKHISFGAKPTVVQLSNGSITLKPSGLGHSYNYSGNKLTTITHTNGRTLTYSWDGERISSAADTAGNAYQFSYNSQGMLSDISWPDGRSKTYLYEDNATPTALTGIELNGVRYAWYEYDAEGKATNSRHFADNYKHSTSGSGLEF